MEEGINYAAIDVGSNACRLLIKNISRDEQGTKCVRKIQFIRIPLRLGMDVFANGKVSKSKQNLLLCMMEAFKHLLAFYDVKYYRACATSAMRDASNGAKLIKKIKKQLGIDLEIISGNEEANIIYNNHLDCSVDRSGNFLYVDVGGGSTEISLINQGELKGSASYDIGTIRLLNGTVEDSVIPSMKENLMKIKESYEELNIIGTGGNIGKLYRLSEDKDKNAQTFPVKSLQNIYNRLSAMTVDERIETYGLKDDRADVIVPAAHIFLEIANCIGAEFVYVPNIGLADGIIDDLFDQYEENVEKQLEISKKSDKKGKKKKS